MTSLEMKSQDGDEERAGSLIILGADRAPHLPHGYQIENEAISHFAGNGGEGIQFQHTDRECFSYQWLTCEPGNLVPCKANKVEDASVPNIPKASFSVETDNSPDNTERGDASSSIHRRQLGNEVAFRYNMAVKLEPHRQEVHHAYHALGLDPTKYRVTTSGTLELQDHRTNIKKEVVSPPRSDLINVPSSARIAIPSTSSSPYPVPPQVSLTTSSSAPNLESLQLVRPRKVKKNKPKSTPIGLEPLIKDDGSMDLINLFRCQVCGKRFKSEILLKEHYIRDHVDNSEWPYKCNTCQMRFPNERLLEKHRDRVRCAIDGNVEKNRQGGYIEENTRKGNDHLRHVFRSGRFRRKWML